jgi:hypothetical protein
MYWSAVFTALSLMDFLPFQMLSPTLKVTPPKIAEIKIRRTILNLRLFITPQERKITSFKRAVKTTGTEIARLLL